METKSIKTRALNIFKYWIALIVLLGTVSSSQALTPLSDLGIEIELVANNINSPIAITHAGDKSGRLFITTQGGQILIFDGNQSLPQPFLDISSQITSGFERGLFSVAFHPNYSSNGFFYVDYTDSNGNTVVSRFSVSSNPQLADSSSESILLTIDQPFSNHNGGQLQFGNDGFLYISTGDGGSSNDPNNRGQDLGDLLGKILRIDVDSGSPFAIPSSNPFVGTAGAREEIWAYGLRNPWRFSFDRETHDMFIGDVGQGDIEEIDFQSASSSGGENYGWRLMEGSNCFNPSSNCNDGSLVLPVLEYNHDGGDCSVTGGYRYRGKRYPKMNGVYFYGDFCTGIIRGATLNSTNTWDTRDLLDSSISISAFGEDENGELYVADVQSNGAIYRIRQTNVSGTPFDRSSRNNVISPYWQSDTQTYTFLNVSHPSLSGMNSQIGLVVQAVKENGSDLFGEIEFTINSNSNRRIFIVGENNPVINPTNVPDAEFILGTSGSSFGQLVFKPQSRAPLSFPGNNQSTGRGFPDITFLSMWGAVVVQGTSTGFAMEFVGDMQDSRAVKTAAVSGTN